MKKILGVVMTIIGAAVVISNLIIKIKGQTSVIIGGADGPTSIFLAGKIGGSKAGAGIIVGIILLAGGIFMIVRKSHKGTHL